MAPGFSADMGRSVPAFFFRNPGLTDPGIRFILETPGVQAAFHLDSVTYKIHEAQTTMRFLGADSRVNIEGADAMDARVNFLLGADTAKWKTGIATYQRIVYRNLYPGIDANYRCEHGTIKSEFVVAPHSGVEQIRLRYENASRVSIEPNGDLEVSESGSELREKAPDIYQDSAAGRTHIGGRYRLLDQNTVGFEVDTYDESRPLVIDPPVSYSTYLGGSSMGSVTGVAADGSGNIYAAGWTESLNFPVSGAIQAANRGGVDAFVVKLNSSGTALVYATYIGGNSDDRASAIAVDSTGQAYVTGSTASTNFPLAAPIRFSLGGGRDAFALKLNAAGNALVYSTYLGGSGWDQGTAIAIDTSGNAYIAGDTQSTDFPTLKAAQAAFGGQTDAFAAKLSSSGALLLSTYLGGSASEHAGGIAVDSGGNVYTAGGTYSVNFPVMNALENFNAGGQVAFVTKLAAGGSAFIYSTYLGGTGTGNMPQQANAIAVDVSGDAYVTGVTGSTAFPITSGALRTSANGMQDAFVSKLNPSGNALVYSTYLGGSTSNWASGIAVDSSGNAYVAGQTSCVDFPMVNAVQAQFNGNYDAFVSEINPSGSALVFSTPYGGSGLDEANAIALDSSANIYIGGQTNSGDFPVLSAFQSSYLGFATGWLTRFGAAVATGPHLLPGTSYTFSWTPTSGADQYWLDVGSAVAYGDYYGSATTATSIDVTTLPCDGRPVYVQVWVHIGGAWQPPTRSTYTAASGCAALSVPVDGATFSAETVAFTWAAVAGVDQYWLDVGNSIAHGDIFGGSTSVTSLSISSIPCDGRTIYVQLWTHIGGVWNNPGRYMFTASNVCGAITSPIIFSTLSGSTVTFNWTAGTGVQAFWLDVGTVVGQGNIFAANLGTALSHTVSGIPVNGSPIYVQLWSQIGGVWNLNRYFYTAF